MGIHPTATFATPSAVCASTIAADGCPRDEKAVFSDPSWWRIRSMNGTYLTNIPHRSTPEKYTRTTGSCFFLFYIFLPSSQPPFSLFLCLDISLRLSSLSLFACLSPPCASHAISVCTCLCLPAPLSLSVCAFVFLSFSPPSHPPPSVCLSVRPSVRLSVCFTPFPPTHPPLFLSSVSPGRCHRRGVRGVRGYRGVRGVRLEVGERPAHADHRFPGLLKDVADPRLLHRCRGHGVLPGELHHLHTSTKTRRERQRLMSDGWAFVG